MNKVYYMMKENDTVFLFCCCLYGKLDFIAYDGMGGLCEKLVKSELTPEGYLCKSCIGTCTFFLYWL